MTGALPQAVFTVLLRVLEKLGRFRKLQINGEFIATRHFLLFKEEDEDSRLRARFPNVWIHHNLRTETPDGPDSHTHPWDTWSYMWHGGYWEEVDGVERFHDQGTWAVLKHGQYHRITKCLPNTVTIFAHGFRKGPWTFKEAPCEHLCEACAPKGQCFAATNLVPYEQHFGGKGSRRAVQWHDADEPNLDKRMSRRRRAIASGRVKLLTREEVRHRLAKEHLHV
jgi:hypothetical protein